MATPLPNEVLARYLDKNDVTHGELAQAIGCSRSHVTRIVLGKAMPTLALGFAIQTATAQAVPASLWLRSPLAAA